MLGDTLELKIILAKNIKYYRYKKKFTQEHLAECLGVSANYIGRLERGQHNPALDVKDKIATILEVQPFELFVERKDYKNLPSRVNLINPKK